MNNILQTIELDGKNPHSFRYFIGVIQTTNQTGITFYQDEIQHPESSKQKHPTLYIIAYVDSHLSKWVMINNSSAINVISSIALDRLKILINFLNAPTLTIWDFNNTLVTTMGIFILPIIVGVKEISMTYHVVKGEI